MNMNQHSKQNDCGLNPASPLIFLAWVITVVGSSLTAQSAPRPPMWPPMPELVRVLHRETFDEVHFAGLSNAVVAIPNYGTLRESWSGYSLERVGTVAPLVISGFDESGQVQVTTGQGAARFWFSPHWSSASVVRDQAPGVAKPLLELAAVEGSQSAVLWSLQVSPDGSNLKLLGPDGSEVLLMADIEWTADSWHQVVLNYGTNGTELVLDGLKVAEGAATLAVPGSVTRLAVGSSLSGEVSAGGELEEVCCFGRPLKLAFHYLPLAGVAALGPMSEAELAYRVELKAKWAALTAQKAQGVEESEVSGGMQMRLSGPSADCITNGPVYLTNVVANFTTNEGWTVYFDIAGGTNEVVYDIFATTEFPGNDITNSIWTWLETGQTCETHWFTNQPTNQVFYILTVPGADRDGDGLYDGWEWKHFGTLEQQSSGDYDGDGDNNATEFANGTDPNSLHFMTRFENLYLSNRTINGSCEVAGGVPARMAVLVNDTNLAGATWTAYSSNFAVTLQDLDGDYEVLVALRGRVATGELATDFTELTLDRVPPVVIFTNPVVANATVFKPYLQLQGSANEPLVTLTYDLTNAAGLFTNETAGVVDQYFDTNAFDFTTNYFQAYDVALTNGSNQITLTVSDRAGNVTVTNLAVTLDYTTATNPPVMYLLWPTNGMHVSGESFYLRGLINDETAQVLVQLVDTNGVTNEMTGLVERNGVFWLEGLPLGTGTNNFTIVATDAAGNVSSTNLSVVKSSVNLTITSTPTGESLYTPHGTVSGTVSDTNYYVTVNGVAATVDEYGTWLAENVPVIGQGTATFDTVAQLSGGGTPQITASVEVEMPAFVALTKHVATLNSSAPRVRSTWSKTYEATFTSELDGARQQTYQGQASSFLSVWDTIWFNVTTDYAWSNVDPVGTYHTVSSGGDFSGPMTVNDWQIKTVPDQSLDHVVGDTRYMVTHFFAKGVRHQWPLENDGVVEQTASARTKLTLFTGGKASMAQKNFICLSASAGEYGKPWQYYWLYTPVSGVAFPKITMLGKSPENDGNLWVVLADNQQIDLGLKVNGAKHASAAATAAKFKLRHATDCAAQSNTNSGRTTIGIGEIVVCSITPAASAGWSVTGGGSISLINGPFTVFTASKSPTTSIVKAKLGTTEKTVTFNVIPPSGIGNVSVYTNLGLGSLGTNGIGAATGFWFDILPTSVSFVNVQFRENLPTNYWVWPSGKTTTLSHKFVGIPLLCGERNSDLIQDGNFPIEWLHNGMGYQDFSYRNTWTNEYLNEVGSWVPFSTLETTTEYRGADQKARETYQGVSGSWQGPWDYRGSF